jgi:hypothetical protein
MREGTPVAQQWDTPPETVIDPDKSYSATIRTNRGEITCKLFADESPSTVNNFVFLAREGFYDGVIFHRVIEGFMIQGGDPTGTGTGGFTEFVPLPFVHQLAPIYLAGVARPGPGWEDSRRVHAVARLLLAGAIDNVQLSWVKLGLDRAVSLLQGGVNDLGGTLMEETISRMAGSEHGVRQSPEALREVAVAAGRPVAERSTLYDRRAPAGIRYQLPV